MSKAILNNVGNNYAAAILSIESNGTKNAVDSMVTREGLADMYHGVTDFLSTKLKKLTNLFKSETRKMAEELADGFEDNGRVRELLAMSSDIVKVMKTVRSLEDYQFLDVPVITGLKSNLHVTSTMLAKAIDGIPASIKKHLIELETITSSILVNPDFRLTRQYAFKTAEATERYTVLHNVISSTIDPTKYVDRMPLKDVLPSIASVERIQQSLLLAVRQVSATSLKDVYKKSDDIDRLVSSIYASSKEHDYVISKPLLDGFVLYTEAVSKLITAYATVIYIIGGSIDTLQHAINIIKKHHKDK